MVDVIFLGLLAIAGGVAVVADIRGRQRWKKPSVEYREACAKFDEMMRKGK